jgi:hypothetical protein
MVVILELYVRERNEPYKMIRLFLFIINKNNNFKKELI